MLSFLKNICGGVYSTQEESQIQNNPVSETAHESFVPICINWESLVRSIKEDGYALDHFDGSDLRLVVGNRILTIIYDRRELGLHSFGIYNYCTTSDKEGHKLMAQIIHYNEEEAYKALLIKESGNEAWLNIADCTNRSAGQHIDNQMIEVFEPIILKFIQNNKVYNNVGLCVSLGEGTSHGALFLCKRLKELGLDIHLAFVASWPLDWIRPEFTVKSNELLTELIKYCRTYKVFQCPVVENLFDKEKIEKSSINTISESISYLKSFVSE
ncbi:MAG: hypothetical protein NC453_11000 [Muribaculum sp.]|nr:hypothetical protein [Muribaculum sp.]